MKHITCIDDLRTLHQRRVPKAFFDYCDRGSYAEETLRANRDDLQDIKFRQRILVDVSRRDTSTMILGEPSTMPLILAPVGLLGMQHGDGEIYACRAAQAAGIPFTQSTMSICSIEDIAANVEKPFWFQLYVMKDRGFIKELIERAIAAKCSALVLTVDLQVIGQRHADIKNGMTISPEWTLSKFLDFATKPAWVSGVLRGKRRTFGNIAGHVKNTEDLNPSRSGPSSSHLTELKEHRVGPPISGHHTRAFWTSGRRGSRQTARGAWCQTCGRQLDGRRPPQCSGDRRRDREKIEIIHGATPSPPSRLPSPQILISAPPPLCLGPAARPRPHHI